MILTITDVTQEFTNKGDEYVKVTGFKEDGQSTTKNVFSNLQDKWPLLKENATLEFKMGKKGQFWNVTDVNPVQTPAPQEPRQPAPYKDAPPPTNLPMYDERAKDIHRQVALKAAVELCTHGIIKVSELKEKSEMLRMYLDGE